MLSTIILKEIRESIYNYRFLFFLIIGVTLIPIGLRVNAVSYLNRVEDYNQQVKSEREAISSAQPWSVQSGNVLIKGFLKPSPLAVFARGLEGTIPQFYTFKPGGYEKGSQLSNEKAFASEFGMLDFTFIVQLVLSLVALIFGADAISGEKELGTLRSVMSNGISRETILLGKLIGGFICIWVSFVLALIIGMLVLGLSSFPLDNLEILERTLLIFSASSVFLVIYYSIGMMISSSTSRTRTSLIAVVVVWTFLQLIIPKVGSMMATLIYPVKTEIALSMEKAGAVNGLEDEKSRILGSKYREIFGRDSVLYSDNGASTKNGEWNLFRKGIEKDYRAKEATRIQTIDSNYGRERLIQDRIATGISFVSPSASFDDLVADLCGTGRTDKKRFTDAVVGYQQMLDRDLFGLIERTPITFPTGRTSFVISITRVQDTKSLPEFSVHRAGLSEIFENNISSLISLALWLIIPFAIAYRRFMRYDVR